MRICPSSNGKVQERAQLKWDQAPGREKPCNRISGLVTGAPLGQSAYHNELHVCVWAGGWEGVGVESQGIRRGTKDKIVR